MTLSTAFMAHIANQSGSKLARVPGHRPDEPMRWYVISPNGTYYRIPQGDANGLEALYRRRELVRKQHAAWAALTDAQKAMSRCRSLIYRAREFFRVNHMHKLRLVFLGTPILIALIPVVVLKMFLEKAQEVLG